MDLRSKGLGVGLFLLAGCASAPQMWPQTVAAHSVSRYEVRASDGKQTLATLLLSPQRAEMLWTNALGMPLARWQWQENKLTKIGLQPPNADAKQLFQGLLLITYLQNAQSLSYAPALEVKADKNTWQLRQKAATMRIQKAANGFYQLSFKGKNSSSYEVRKLVQ